MNVLSLNASRAAVTSLVAFDQSGQDREAEKESDAEDLLKAIDKVAEKNDTLDFSEVAQQLSDFASKAAAAESAGHVLEVEIKKDTLYAAIGEERITIAIDDKKGRIEVTEDQVLTNDDAASASASLSRLVARDREGGNGEDPGKLKIEKSNEKLDELDAVLTALTQDGDNETVTALADTLGRIETAVSQGASLEVEVKGKAFKLEIDGEKLEIRLKADGKKDPELDVKVDKDLAKLLASFEPAAKPSAPASTEPTPPAETPSDAVEQPVDTNPSRAQPAEPVTSTEQPARTNTNTPEVQSETRANRFETTTGSAGSMPTGGVVQSTSATSSASGPSDLDTTTVVQETGTYQGVYQPGERVDASANRRSDLVAAFATRVDAARIEQVGVTSRLIDSSIEASTRAAAERGSIEQDEADTEEDQRAAERVMRSAMESLQNLGTDALAESAGGSSEKVLALVG